MDTIYSKNADFVQREVAGECILIPVRRQLTDVNSLYVLNETGAALWRRIDGKTPLQDIATDFLNEFDATQAQIEKDVASLIEDLLSIHAIQEAGPGP
nr:PqqD family protein [Nitrospirota bacterium]